jgi:hypothetical protein
MSDLSEVFREFFAGLTEHRDPDRPDDPFRRCFGCGPAHPSGLRVRCFRTEEGVASPIVVPRVYEGPPGAVHGGIVAAYLDEILGGAVASATGTPAVTGELTVATWTWRAVSRSSAPGASWRPRAGASFP